MGTVEATALLDSIALADAADEAGVTLTQARKLAAALGEMPADQACRITGEAARLAKVAEERKRRTGR